MRHLFILDPLADLRPNTDSSIALMRAANRRGHAIETCVVQALSLRPGARTQVLAAPTRLVDGPTWYATGAIAAHGLDAFDVVWMRKDPPVDLEYLYATHVLSFAPRTTLVVNAAHALREANEKLFALRFPALCPETVVSRQLAELQAFRAELGGEMVVKPLGGAGGAGVFHIQRGDPNARSILEVMTDGGRRHVIAQRYLPEIRAGDKRIILIEGEPAGAVLRVPKPGEARANFNSGGEGRQTTLTVRERMICAALAPTLRDLGIVFAGIDVIGDWLTEVNVTSPSGLREITALDGVHLEERLLDAVEARVAALR